MKKCKIFLTALATTCFVFLLTATSAAVDASSTAGTVATNSGNLTVRASASTSASSLASLSKGSLVTLLGRSGSWWRVEYAAGRTGYVHADYITQLRGSAAVTVATASGPLNVRIGPGSNYGVSGSLPRGSRVVSISQAGAWTKVLYDGVKTGFVSSAYLSSSPPSGSSGGSVSLPVPDYKQYDARWASVKIGGSGQTMKQIGCTTTALAMTESYRTGSSLRPDTLSRQLSYTPGGAVYWPDRYQPYYGSDYLSVLRDKLQDGVPIIVGAKNSTGKGHWVVVTGHNGSTGLRASDFTVNDPGSTWRTNLQHLFNEYPNFYKLKYYAW